MSKLRRRSTMHWGAANPRERQQKLEDVALDRLVDTWFSLHHEELNDPIYISEVMERSMNPSFSFFDLNGIPASVARSDELDIKIWTRNAQSDGYKMLLDLSANLRSLQFIGKSLDNFHHPLPQNCVLFHLDDGIYTSFTDLAADDTPEPQLRTAQKSMAVANTSSYDALMKLANLDECIQDALQTRLKLEADINVLLAKNKAACVSPEQIEMQKEKGNRTKHALTAEKKQVEQLRNKKAELQKSRERRKQVMTEVVEVGKAASDIPAVRQEAAEVIRADIERLFDLSTGQIRRVCEELLQIYPIEAIKHRALQFTIRNIYLPNSVFDDTNRDEIAAALGYTGQLVRYLALYMSIPLPYPINFNGSNSFIEDPISVSLAQRRFPLHPTNVTYKFEYGVFLLNKDIEFLMSRAGLRVLDIRHTLPNLKYLMYVLTAGTGELPARKAGGVRGLWGGPIAPHFTRRGSDDTVDSRTSLDDQSSETSAAGKEKAAHTAEALIVSGRVKGLPYRRSLLHEVG